MLKGQQMAALDAEEENLYDLRNLFLQLLGEGFPEECSDESVLGIDPLDYGCPVLRSERGRL